MLAAVLPPGHATALSAGCGATVIFHIALHFLVPALVAALFWRRQWWQCFLWLMAGLLIDVDHVLAEPVYDPLRCSIGFHPLHTWPALLVYLLSGLHPRTRLLALGLLLHLALDAGDCALMPGGTERLLEFLPHLPG